MYKIISYAAIFPMTFSFSKEDGQEPISLNVDVDYLNNKVYFRDKLQHPELDYAKLEEDILNKLIPEEFDLPHIPEEIMEKTRKVNGEDYFQDLIKNMNRGSYDSRQS